MVKRSVYEVVDAISGKLVVRTTCSICTSTKVLEIDAAGYNRWKLGTLIQDALPELSAEQREMLITGICPECWEKMFGGDDE